MSKDTKRPMSRRKLLKGIGAGAIGASLTNLGVVSAQDTGGASGGSQSGGASGGTSTSLPLALERFQLGDMEVIIFQETTLELQPSMYGGGAPEGAVSELLGQYNLPNDVISGTANVMLLNTGGDYTLIDTGTGENLVPTLETIGVSPSDVSNVIISHYHGDHISGMSMNGTLTFPNAMHHLSQTEWDFLQSASSDNDGAQTAIEKLQPAVDANQITYFSGGDEVVNGVQAVDAFGHTPGHTMFRISSSGESLLFTADTATHALISPMHPGWAFAFDGDPEQAAQTRRELFTQASSEGTRIFSYHFAFPGLGYIAQEGEAFRFTPA